MGLCGINIVVKSMTWSALNALILMTTITTDELPGEMDYHVFVALSVTIVAVLCVAPNATNRTSMWMVCLTFGAFLCGTGLFFQAERIISKYQLMHSLWHASFATSAMASVYSIKQRAVVHRPPPPLAGGGIV